MLVDLKIVVQILFFRLKIEKKVSRIRFPLCGRSSPSKISCQGISIRHPAKFILVGSGRGPPGPQSPVLAPPGETYGEL